MPYRDDEPCQLEVGYPQLASASLDCAYCMILLATPASRSRQKMLLLVIILKRAGCSYCGGVVSPQLFAFVGLAQLEWLTRQPRFLRIIGPLGDMINAEKTKRAAINLVL